MLTSVTNCAAWVTLRRAPAKKRSEKATLVKLSHFRERTSSSMERPAKRKTTASVSPQGVPLLEFAPPRSASLVENALLAAMVSPGARGRGSKPGAGPFPARG